MRGGEEEPNRLIEIPFEQDVDNKKDTISSSDLALLTSKFQRAESIEVLLEQIGRELSQVTPVFTQHNSKANAVQRAENIIENGLESATLLVLSDHGQLVFSGEGKASSKDISICWKSDVAADGVTFNFDTKRVSGCAE